MGRVCITTIQGLAAAVHGIESLRRGEIDVRSLQDYAERLRPHHWGESPTAPAGS